MDEHYIAMLNTVGDAALRMPIDIERTHDTVRISTRYGDSYTFKKGDCASFILGKPFSVVRGFVSKIEVKKIVLRTDSGQLQEVFYDNIIDLSMEQKKHLLCCIVVENL